MRVIHISPTAFGADGLYGGGERYPVELARALSRRIDCKLITFGSLPRSYRDGDLDVIVLRRAALLLGHPAHPVPRGLLRSMKGADIVHLHHVRALPSRIAAVAATLAGRRRVVTDHGLGPGRWPGIDAHLFDRFLMVSRYSARTVRSPAAKTTVIYGGADPNRFHPDEADGRSGVLFVGRLTPHKGVDLLIEALPQGATLTLAGTEGHDRNPPERDYPHLLRELAHGRDVRFIGAVNDPELPRLYRRARVLVLPSVHTTRFGKRIAIPELLGLVLLEAMACGTPVIASNIGGLPEVVADGVTGFVVEPGNTGELRSHIARLLSDPKLADEMGANARRHVIDNFTWDACAARCQDVYEELMDAE